MELKDVYSGTSALVKMHDRAMRDWLATWEQAKQQALALPSSKAPAYESLDHLLYHSYRADGSYLKWICEQLNCPCPDIDHCPSVPELAEKASSYLDHLLDCWQGAALTMTEEQAYTPEYPSRWQTKYCLDAMLEHAVMHPLRHQFQLQTMLQV